MMPTKPSDLIETELFKSKMPSVSYMRLDGSVPAGSRHSIVSKFNHDPSIDVLLLTTKGSFYVSMMISN